MHHLHLNHFKKLFFYWSVWTEGSVYIYTHQAAVEWWMWVFFFFSLKIFFQIQGYLVLVGSDTQPGSALIGRSARPGLSSASRQETCQSNSTRPTTVSADTCRPYSSYTLAHSHTEVRKHCDICMSSHMQMCMCSCHQHTHTQARLCYFTWLCSGPRRSGTPQRGLWWCRFSYSWPEAGERKLRFTEEKREETECRKTEVTSEYKLHVQSGAVRKKRKRKKTQTQWHRGGKRTNCMRDSSQVTTY